MVRLPPDRPPTVEICLRSRRIIGRRARRSRTLVIRWDLSGGSGVELVAGEAR
ncbi:hypothetical protein [Streptosporangium sp. KLBMP 9127]|nr:hypothetical protein [Streptosporangium sp. KLBMP 9127]